MHQTTHQLLTQFARIARGLRAGATGPARLAGRAGVATLVALSLGSTVVAAGSETPWPPEPAAADGAATFQQVASFFGLETSVAGEPALAEAGAAGESSTTSSEAPATTAAPTTTAPPPPQPSVLPAVRGPLPVGKGMWLYLEERTEGGNAQAIVEKARAYGVNHLYVRTGSSWKGFYAHDFLNRLLPAAHGANIRVYGWDFPNLRDARGDVDRALAAIRYTTPDGHRIDGFAADIETRFEGTNILPETALHYGTALRLAVGGTYPLIAVVPNPSPSRVADFPYATVLGPFDAVAPMVYWLNRQPDTDVARALQYLAQFGKPVFPIGQAYDGAAEGGRPGVPSRDELLRFFAAADEHGAAGVSFWSWQGADQQAWDAIRDAPQFALTPQPETYNRGQARSLQVLLSSLAFAAPASGVVDDPTKAAVAAYQQAAGLAPTGVVDEVTFRLLMTPFPPPLTPMP
jgi:hypothetical protein